MSLCYSIQFYKPPNMALMESHSPHLTRFLNGQLHVFNCQKTLAHQLLVKLQGQLLASHFVLNALLDEFSNINSIYKSYKPTIWSAVQLFKTESETMSPPEIHYLKEAYYPS